MGNKNIYKFLRLGVEAHKLGRLEEAEHYYKSIIKLDPTNSDANHNMGVLAVGTGKSLEAVSFFKIALKTNPEIQQYWLSYIDVLKKLDRLDELGNVFDEAKKNGVSSKKLIDLEKQLCLLNNEKSEKEPKTKLQNPPPDQIKPVLDLYARGDLSSTLNSALNLLLKYPNSFILLNLVAAINQSFGKNEKAIQFYYKALSLNPNSAELHNNIGTALQDCGKLKDAVKAYEKAVSLDSNFADGYFNLGNLLSDIGNLTQAVGSYVQALACKPDYLEAYNNLGIVLHDLGRFDEAIKAYKKALSFKPDYAAAYSNIGNAFIKKSQYQEAASAYTKSLAINPNLVEAIKNLVTLPLGFVEEKNLQIIEHFLKKNAVNGKVSSDLQFTEANYLTHCKNFKFAFEKFLLANKQKFAMIGSGSNWPAKYVNSIEQVKDWDPTLSHSNENAISKFFIIAPPRSGKSQLENLLSAIML